ncbi:dihydrofolate reductase [Nocardioides sp. SYSU D00065]|uniref:dihydrofolate reductase n=1 Tax=Nocardioides sp. SYSU D00065 TaxID=2817378 RepID=UPI001B336B85|nr:dihydrofolate reductase [Nocardioides sp. SYSU D00065]
MSALRPDQRVVLVAAHARNRVIGDGGRIPWHLPHDFAHFKRETLGHTLVMGRRTWDSIGRPLPGRATVVVTREESFDPGFDDVRVAHSLEDAFALAAELPGDVMVAGGGEIYALALPYATHQVLTEVDLDPPGDAYYPEYAVDEWVEVRREAAEGCEFVWLERAGAAA